MSVQSGDQDRVTIATLAARALDQARGLMRREVDLARAELEESASLAGAALGLLAGAMVLALAALHVLTGALIAALAELGLDPAWGALIVGAVLAFVAGAMASRGMADLKSAQIAPRQAGESVRKDARTVVGAMSGAETKKEDDHGR